MRVDMSNVDGKQIYDDKISGKRDSNSVSNEELKKIGFNQKKYTELMHKSGCNDYKVSDDTPIPFYTAQFGSVKNDFEFNAMFHNKHREAINLKISSLLERNGFKVVVLPIFWTVG